MSNEKRINHQTEIEEHEMYVLIENMCNGLIVKEITLITEGLSTTNYKVSIKNHK